MSRKLISESELVSWVNSQLKTTEDCSSASVSGATEVTEPENNNGCNWSITIYRAGSSSPELCSSVFNKIIAEASTKFNVDWPRH